MRGANRGSGVTPLLDLVREDVRAVWYHERAADISWYEGWDEVDHCQLYNPDDIRADLMGDLPLPYDGAWVARCVDGAWWYRLAPDARWRGAMPDYRAADDVVIWALGLRAAELVPWVGRGETGWPMPRGWYGFIVPEREFVLVAGDVLRWVVQTRTPRGCYAMVFDRFTPGADGQPHPRGLWRIDSV